MFKRATIAIVFTAVLSSCSTLPPEVTDEKPVPFPEKWSQEVSLVSAENYTQNWSEDFDSPQLRELIEMGLSENFTLDAAYARLQRAEAAARLTGANKWPSLSAGFRATRSQRNNTGGLQITSQTTNTFAPSLDVSWELDLWGQTRNEHRAEIAVWQAEQEVYQNARLSLAANIARSWISLVERNMQLDLTQQTLRSLEQGLRVVEENFRAGIARALELQLAKSNIAGTRSTYERQKRLYDSELRSLQVLLGDYPDGEFEIVSKLPEIGPTIPAGLPAEMLKRRPDIVAAERRLSANSERISAAKKSFIPSIRLTGSGGTQSGELSNVTSTDFKVWNIAANLTQPIFNSGRLRSALDRSKANYQESLANYGQTLLNAFQEVETLLAAESFFKDELSAQEHSMQETKLSAEMAWEEYINGLTDISTFLESQRRAFNAESNFLQTAADRIRSRINLYLALGGDFIPHHLAEDIEVRNDKHSEVSQ